jgi:hypothetical protein
VMDAGVCFGRRGGGVGRGSGRGGEMVVCRRCADTRGLNKKNSVAALAFRAYVQK